MTSKGVTQQKLIRTRIAGTPPPGPFRYFDKGNLAVVGKGFAVLQSGNVHLSGFVAWLAWSAVHLQYLAQSSLRVSVFLRWIWTYLTGQRGSRLIVNPRVSESNRDCSGDAQHPRSSSKIESAEENAAEMACGIHILS